ncbi:MAG: twin-arginine translocase subunit TatC [Prevotellaceae bacterium]|nr:twin-arginine translocase subunit TatC [Prevotellaceae bacterium]
MTFWEHLEELRGTLIRAIVAALVGVVVAFSAKDWLFWAIMAPARPDFITYRLMGLQDFHLHLINTALTEQFMVHLRMALAVGILLASPYIIYVLFCYVSPALLAKERRYSLRITLAAYLMFLVGVAVNYFVVFPLTVRFLSAYQISPEVEPMLAISSYSDTLLGMSLVMGIAFETPVVSWILALAGLLRHEWMQRYRRHAVVLILIVAAVITPTGDIFTLLVVSLPIWLLYEASVLITMLTERKYNAITHNA